MSIAARCHLIVSKGFRRSYTFPLMLLLFGLCPGFISPSQALATDPGDNYVFPAQSPVAPDGTSQQGGPTLSGNIALWTEYDSSLRKTRLFFKDLSKGPGEPGHALISEEYNGATPAINQAGNRVVWSEMIGALRQVYSKDVDFSGSFSGCTGTVNDCATALSPGNSWQENPSISPDGGKVAWEYGRGHGSQIHLYDFNTGIVQELYGMPGGDQEYPSVDNEWIIWEDNRDYNSFVFPLNQHIYAKRIGSLDAPVSIADNGGSAHASVGSAKIGRNLNNEPVVVYVKTATGNPSSFTIRLHNLADGSDVPLVRSSGRLESPSINGDKVVWLDCSENWRCDVILHDLSTDVIQTVSQDPSLGSKRPVVSSSSGYIVWRTTQSSPITIYYNRMGDTAQGLADKYRPELRMTMGENFEPMPVEQFLSAPGTTLRQRNNPEFSILNPAAALLTQYENTPDLYIDLQGDSIAAGGGNPSRSIDHNYVRNHYAIPYQARRDQTGNQFPRTIYARVVSRPEGNENSFIQYWIYYAANDHAEIFHEGDWEVVQIDLDGKLKPYRANYSQHGYGQWRNWEGPGHVEKSEALPDQPVVYVGVGSHANYFTANAEHPIYYQGVDLSYLQVWDDASGSGVRLNNPNAPDTMTGPIYTQVKVIPEANQIAIGSEFEWLKFTGQWGEFTNADVGQEGCWTCQPPRPGFRLSGLRNGADNPPLQAYWTSAFAWNGNNCDGCQDEQAQGTDTQCTALSPVDISLYDAQGRHTGKNADGSIDQQIPNSEYLEYPDLHRKSIIIHGSDINPGYRLEATGNGTGPASFIVTAPDHPGGYVDTLNYNSVQVSPSTKVIMNLDSTKNYTMSIDADGNGTNVIQKSPDTTTTNIIDFTPPAQVSNLAAIATSAGTATLSFIAPGDDGNTGTATAYDLRYSTAAITDLYWQDAVPVSGLQAPLLAGSSQTITVSGLSPGTTYYFALKAMDEAALFSTLSNVATGTTTIPSLTWLKQRVYWANWTDYQNRQLSIDYRMSNTGTGAALESTVQASFCNPATVYAVTQLPSVVGNINPGSNRTVTLKYYVPTTVGSFTTTTYATCNDDIGNTYWFPRPMT